MNAYVSRQFRRGTTQYSVFATDSELKIEISCHNFNFKNYWGGEFLSSWTVDLTGSQAVSGHAKIHNHYFEQGNIQFNLNKSFPGAKPKSFTGKGIVDLISRLESEVY